MIIEDKRFSIFSLIFTFLSIGFVSFWLFYKRVNAVDYQDFVSLKSVLDSFPRTENEIFKKMDFTISGLKDAIAKICSIDSSNRTYYNTVRAYDKASSAYSMCNELLGGLKMLHPDEKIRTTASKALEEGQRVAIDLLESKEIYQALNDYQNNNKKNEKLTDAEEYFLTELMKDLERSGLGLNKEKFEQAQKLKKEIASLALKFHTNIDTDQSSISVSIQELDGLSKEFISNLNKNGDLFILTCDYPTYYEVMENCSVSSTREKLWNAFSNRAYPANVEIFKEIIKLRDQLAKVLGFESYADLNIDGQMAKTSHKVKTFLLDLISKSESKMTFEFMEFTKDLPNGVKLTSNNQFKPWDFAYVKNYYKKNNFNVDEREIAEYFPMDKTIEALFDIYQKFFKLKFEITKVEGLWHEDLSAITVYNADKTKILGYVILDLYPRPNKYSHACMCPLVGPIKFFDKEKNTMFERVGVAMLIANFTKQTADKPSLLKHSEVETFFHEFGHVMHQLLGKTEIASFAGTATKTDFVEMPSQMFEEWMWDKDTLSEVSCHYLTSQVLPSELIDKKLKLKKFDTGFFLQRQIILALISLNLFLEGEDKDTQQICKDLNLKYNKFIEWDDRSHHYYSFGHLVGYDAKYYSYLWSKVFALDLFESIKERGLLSSDVGIDLANKVLGKGGEVDPEALLIDFLGRKPNQDAFLRDMGLAA